MLIQLDVHHSEGRVDEIFRDIKHILYLLEGLEARSEIKEAIVYYVFRTATFFGTSIEMGDLREIAENNDIVNIGCLPILTALGL